MDNINKELRTEAVLNGLCIQWQNNWLSDKSQDELIEMYKKGIDFCIKNNYPSLEWAEENLDKEIMHKHHVYLNDPVFEPDAENDVYVFNGECLATIALNGYSVATIFVRNNSSVSVVCNDNSKAFISAYDDSVVAVTAPGDKSKIFCYNYNHSKIKVGEGKIVVKNR